MNKKKIFYEQMRRKARFFDETECASGKTY